MQLLPRSLVFGYRYPSVRGIGPMRILVANKIPRVRITPSTSRLLMLDAFCTLFRAKDAAHAHSPLLKGVNRTRHNDSDDKVRVDDVSLMAFSTKGMARSVRNRFADGKRVVAQGGLEAVSAMSLRGG